MQRRLMTLALATVSFALPWAAQAQDRWPSKAIEIIYPYPPGNDMDVVTRLLAEGMSNVRELGLQIYTTYLLPFELAAVLLLLAIVAAIALTMRKRKDTKYIDPAVQVRVQRADRVRVLKMDAEPRANADTDNNESAA